MIPVSLLVLPLFLGALGSTLRQADYSFMVQTFFAVGKDDMGLATLAQAYKASKRADDQQQARDRWAPAACSTCVPSRASVYARRSPSSTPLDIPKPPPGASASVRLSSVKGRALVCLCACVRESIEVGLKPPSSGPLPHDFISRHPPPSPRACGFFSPDRRTSR